MRNSNVRLNRTWGRAITVVAVVVSSSLASSVEAVGQPAAGSTTTTTVVTTTPDPSVIPPPPAGQVPVVPEPDPSPRIRVSLARLAVIDARTTLLGQQQSAAGARDEQALAQAALDGAEQVHADAERQLSSARARLGSTAVYAYMLPPGGDVASVVRGDANVGREQRELLAVSLDHHQQLVVDARAAVERARGDVEAAQQDLAAAQLTAADHDSQVAAATSVLADARDELRTAIADLWRPMPWTPWQLTIQGTSAFTADELARWYEAQSHGSQASVPMATLTRAYVELGDTEGIRGDMAFAQSIHETGWFANLDTITANNFAGIGHCDACNGGYPFATADLGVLAQIQLLKSYADADPVYVLPRADPDLDGPSGCCQTWTELGGVWATDGGYGPRILRYYADMLEWLVAERTAGA